MLDVILIPHHLVGGVAYCYKLIMCIRQFGLPTEATGSSGVLLRADDAARQRTENSRPVFSFPAAAIVAMAVWGRYHLA